MTIEIAPYDPAWATLFGKRGQRLRSAVGVIALRIDHIGSTSVPGLAAKPIIDIQISVASFEPLDAFRLPLEGLGYIFRSGNPDQTKRYFREAPGEQREHIHVRKAGSSEEQLALLFRDYMRTHTEEAMRYASAKQQLAGQYADDRLAYTGSKTPFISDAMHWANDWSQEIGWELPPSDC